MKIWDKLNEIKGRLVLIVGLITALGFLINWGNNKIVQPVKSYVEFQTEVRSEFDQMKFEVKNLSERNKVNSGIDQSNMFRFGTGNYTANVKVMEGGELQEIVKMPMKIFVARSTDLYGWVEDKGLGEGASVYVIDYQKGEQRLRYADFGGNICWVEESLCPDEVKQFIEEALEQYE